MRDLFFGCEEVGKGVMALTVVVLIMGSLGGGVWSNQVGFSLLHKI
jgi:hypothetical protein